MEINISNRTLQPKILWILFCSVITNMKLKVQSSSLQPILIRHVFATSNKTKNKIKRVINSPHSYYKEQDYSNSREWNVSAKDN